MLNSEQVQQFHRDGFVAARNVIDPYTLEKIRAAADAWLEKSRTLTTSTPEIELDKGHTAEEPKLARLNHPVTLDPDFWDAASSDAVLDNVEAVIGGNIKFHHSKLNMKASKGGAAIGWHQDFAFFPHTNDDLVACGIALDDCTVENGCLLVVPGTHRMGLLNHFGDDQQFKGKITSDLDKFDEAKASPV